jgi:type II secretory pathway component PulF
MKDHPREFNDFYVSMVRSGEAAAISTRYSFTLAEFLERQRRLKDKVSSAMTYPVIMMFTHRGHGRPSDDHRGATS